MPIGIWEIGMLTIGQRFLTSQDSSPVYPLWTTNKSATERGRRSHARHRKIRPQGRRRSGTSDTGPAVSCESHRSGCDASDFPSMQTSRDTLQVYNCWYTYHVHILYHKWAQNKTIIFNLNFIGIWEILPVFEKIRSRKGYYCTHQCMQTSQVLWTSWWQETTNTNLKCWWN